MKLLDEIREQPLHIRKIFMWTLVVISFSFIGYAWFENTQKDFVALLNRTDVPAERERALAQSTPEPASPFQNIKNSISNFGANISKLLRGSDARVNPPTQPAATIKPQKLP